MNKKWYDTLSGSLIFLSMSLTSLHSKQVLDRIDGVASGCCQYACLLSLRCEILIFF